MIRKFLPWLAGAAWGLLVFLAGMHLFFPSGTAVERLQYELDRASDGGWQLQAAGASPWRGTGLKLEGVELLQVDKSRRSKGDEEGEGPSATRFLVADHVAVRAQLLPLLTGTRQAGFDADLYRGDLNGTVGLSGEQIATTGQASSLDLALVPFAGETLTLDLDGALDASWALTIDTADPTQSSGTIELAIEGLVLNSASVAGFDLEETSRFSKAELSIEVEDGKAKVKRGDLVGDLIEAKIDGEITLSKKFDRSRLRLGLEFTLAEHIDNLVKLLPTAKDARWKDGRYHFTVSGTILHPSFRAERERRTSSRGSREPTEAGPSLRPGGIEGAEDVADDAEERRKLREERIRERRERLRQRREETKTADAGTEGQRDDRDDRDFRDEEEELFDDEPPDFQDELPVPVERYDDVELHDAPYEDDDLGEFEDEF